MRRPLVVLPLLFALVFVLLAVPGGRAAAEPLAPRLCTLHTSIETDLAGALERKHECRPGVSGVAGPRVWAFAELPRPVTSEEPLLLITEPTSFEAMSVHVREKGGSWRSRAHDSTIASQRWQAGTRFTAELPPHRGPVTAIAVSFDRPQTSANFTNLALIPEETAEQRHKQLSLLFALFVGLMIAPIVYNLVFYSVLREKFMLWHVVMTTGVIGYALFSSGIVHIFLPDMSIGLRRSLNLWSIALAISAAGMFCRAYFEPGMLGPLLRRALTLAAPLLFAATAIFTLGGEGVRARGPALYFLAFLPVLIVYVAAIVQALMRGSRAARFQTAAWAGLILLVLERIGRGAGLYAGDAMIDNAVYFALAFEVIVTALGVADRFMILRRERDVARDRGAAFEQLAVSDSLTGLINRRGLEKIFWENRTSGEFAGLALLDIDHFKQINDRYGHACGDDVLKAVGREFKRAGLCATRIGGEEFVLMLEGRDRGPFDKSLEKIQRDLTRAIKRDLPHIAEPVTASIGVAVIERGAILRDVLALADQRLYAAKRAGRNCIVRDQKAPARAAA